MSDIFSVLADPTRRALLQALAVGPRTVGDLVSLTGEGQPTVSKHLKTLRDAGLVSVEAAGQARVYSIDRGPLAEIEAFIAEVAPGMGGIGAGAANAAAKQAAKEPANDVEKVLTDAAVTLSGWLNEGATWLGAKVQEKITDANIDPEKLGKELGRKLADAKLQATDAASDAQASLRAELGDLSSRIGVTAADLRSAAEIALDGTKRAAAERIAEAKEAVLNRARPSRGEKPETD